MKKTLTYLVLLASLTSNAQDNWRPVDSASSWTGRNIDFPGVGTPNESFIHFYTLSNDYDTLIGGLSYSKLYLNGDYFNAFRADTIERSIYFIPKDSTEEYLFFNFNETIDVGDTVLISYYREAWPTSVLTCDLILWNLDSTLIEDEWYKRYYFNQNDDSGPPCSSSFGINIMERVLSVESFPFISPHDFEISLELKCYSENEDYFYGVHCPFTSLYGSLPNFKENAPPSIIIYPNPIEDDLFIRTNHSGELIIYNTQGKILLKKQIDTKALQINCRGLTKGVYFYSFFSSAKKNTGKFVKI